MTDGSKCPVNTELFHHTFLIPAAGILAVLAFLNKRRSFKTDVLDGRPGLVIPYDYLGYNANRFTICAVFGAITSMILNIATETFVGGIHGPDRHLNSWAKSFLFIGQCLEIAFLCYPFFACLTTKYKIFGSSLGICYVVPFSVLSVMGEFSHNCRNQQPITLVVLQFLPTILCFFYIFMVFVITFCLEVKRLLITQTNYHEETNNWSNSWMRNYVEELLSPRFLTFEPTWKRYTKFVYSPAKNFEFSVQTLATVTVCSLSLYLVLVLCIYTGGVYIDAGDVWETGACKTPLNKTLGAAFLVSSVLTGLVSGFSLVRFMDCHKNNMLRLFKGDTSFLPNGNKKSHYMVGKCLKYSGYQIAYFFWGSLMTAIIIFLITTFFIAAFDCKPVGTLLKEVIIRSVLPTVVIVIIVYLILMVSSVVIFRDKNYPKSIIALDNRNLYLVFSFFFFFLALPVGLFSSISRVLKGMVIAFSQLPRVDTSVLPRGFENFDTGHKSYVCYLHVLATHRNPVLCLFCHYISNPTITRKNRQRYRNKWKLLFILTRNPQLCVLRKHVLPTFDGFETSSHRYVSLEVV